METDARDAQLIVKRGTKIGKAAAGLRERLEDEIQRLRGVLEGFAVPGREVDGTKFVSEAQ